MNKYKIVLYKTYAYYGAPPIFKTVIVEAYDKQHAQLLVDKQDYLIMLIEKL